MSTGTSAFGTWLKERRRQQDLTQTELAVRAGCSLETVQKLEAGARRPSRQMVEAIAEHLDLSPTERAEIIALARLGADGSANDGQPHTNLPRLLTSFVGRKSEIAEIKRLLADNQLVTLTGPGGSGKTRLALAIADDVSSDFPDGIYFVDLAAVTDERLVLQALASAMGLREQPGTDLTDTLRAYLEKRSVLAVLDNCEHLIQACASLVRALLPACLRLHILATSRQPLALSYELTWSVPPLALPEPKGAPAPEELVAFAAIQLFVQRARQRLPSFELSAGNASSVLELCRRLDGMPLAIELAAARVRVLTVEQIVERLDERFQLLTAPGSDVSSRQRTLKSTIDWSYHLLSDSERNLFNGLSVFAESFTLEAVRAVCMAEASELDTIDLLTSLIDKSLVVASSETGAELRYRLLETICQYGLEQLAQADELAQARNRHLDYYLQLAATAAPKLKGPEQLQWFERLERENENFRAALSWSVNEPAAHERGLRLAVALHWFWHVRSYLSESRYWLESLLARTQDMENSSLRAAALHALGMQAWLQYDIEAGQAAMEESMVLAQRARDNYAVAKATSGMAMLADFGGDMAAARAWNARALAAFSELGSLWDIAWALTGSGIMAMHAGDYASAAVQFEENIQIYREIGDEWATAIPMAYLGIALQYQSKYSQAREAMEQARDIYLKFGDHRRVMWQTVDLGDVALAQKDLTGALRHYLDGLRLFGELGTKPFGLAVMRGAAYLAKERGDLARAAKLLGALSILKAGIQHIVGVPPWDTAREEYPDAWREGETMSMDHAITAALESLVEKPIESNL